VTPQPPQLNTSLLVSRQNAPQRIRPAAHTHPLSTHDDRVGQTFEHEPQLLTFDDVSTQAEPHSVALPGQSQAPSTHAAPEGHTMPQAPQCVVLTSVSTQALPQRICPLGHRQEPALHVSAARQLLPHAPQLNRSLTVSMQPEPQSREPLGHTQRLLEHSCSSSQAAAQAPQCASLDARSTHSSPHTVSRALAQPQREEMQRTPTPHALPQVPQCDSSRARSTQRPPQRICPAGHTHSPSVHIASEPHTFPQRPQLLGSSFGTITPSHTRQSSPRPLQSSSTPFPHRSVADVAVQPQTVGAKPSALTQPQFEMLGQSSGPLQR